MTRPARNHNEAIPAVDSSANQRQAIPITGFPSLIGERFYTVMNVPADEKPWVPEEGLLRLLLSSWRPPSGRYFRFRPSL
jgi:hypothetical protein